METSAILIITRVDFYLFSPPHSGICRVVMTNAIFSLIKLLKMSASNNCLAPIREVQLNQAFRVRKQ